MSRVESWSFGEIILQTGKFFQNIGYEYYIERSKSECLQFIKAQIDLISEAIQQFDDKLKEANETLKNMQKLSEQQTQVSTGRAAPSLQATDHHEPVEFSQFMEIREELDEDGNVIDSSVTPAKDIVQSDSEIVPDNTQFSIAPDSMYTFDDLVEQLDKIDAQEDGEVVPGQVVYDFSSFDEVYSDEDVDDDDDDDYDDAGVATLVPGAAQQSFMEQINALRNSKRTSVESETKSIMKKGNSQKKSVNFAPELDVFEVENMKNETRSNTFKFNRTNFPSEMEIEEIKDSDVEFDADLFAQMIGAKEADVLHDKFASSEPEFEQPARPKKRVSRFKREKTSALDNISSPVMATSSEPDVVTSDIVERDVPYASPTAESISETTVSDIVERDDTRLNNSSRQPPKHSFAKEFKSLQKPRSKPKKQVPIDFSDDEINEDGSLQEPRIVDATDKLHEIPSKFPIQEEVAVRPTIDFSQLTDLDDMARAYLLGIYNDDVEDPGTVVEETADFDEYNKMALELQPEIEDFISSTIQDHSDEKEPMIQEVLERTPAEDYNAKEIDEQLLYAQLQQEYLAYKNMRLHSAAVSADLKNSEESSIIGGNEDGLEDEGKEPIDEFGNPITISRFKAQARKARNMQYRT